MVKVNVSRSGQPVSYQNKDITSKIFGEGMREKSLAVYGISVPRIIDVLPTNLPAIEANELRMDNLYYSSASQKMKKQTVHACVLRAVFSFSEMCVPHISHRQMMRSSI